MNYEAYKQTVLVPLPLSFVDTLLNMRAAFDDDLVFAFEKSVDSSTASIASPSHQSIPAIATPERGGYAAEFLGVSFTTRTLPEVFARIVDLTADVAPEVLISLAGLRARKRRYVARTREEVHPFKSRLPVMQTSSGWWISKNIGQEDLKRALRALCRVSGLSFGKDLKFSLR